jgi:KDO2-lipid IV(A) lauroyltransferase
MLDWARSTAWGPEEVLARVEMVGLEHVRRALDKGRGVFGLSAHMGCFELAAKAGEIHGIPLTMVARAMANKRLYELVCRERTRMGGEVIDRDRAASGILRALRANRLVSIVNDQYARRTRAVFVPFFGVRCSTSAGLATLAERSGAPVIPFFTYRDGPDHHYARFLPPLEPLPTTGDRTKDIEQATARYNEVLEEIIRAHPEHWMWAHRRYRHSPDLPDVHY